jgi:site-specific recombinase XerD
VGSRYPRCLSPACLYDIFPKSALIYSFEIRWVFTINLLRPGVDVFSLQKLMRHADLQVLRRYLAQTTEDIAQAHRIGSPLDNA